MDTITSHFEQSLKKNSTRPDGRTLATSRDISVGFGAITTADSSALIQLGHTSVICATRLIPTQTTASTSTTSLISVHVEMPPLASPEIRPGRVPEIAEILTEQLTLIIHRCIDEKQLIITPGTAWSISLDIYIMSADGGLLEASLQAAVCALTKLVLKSVTVNESSGAVEVNPQGQTKALEWSCIPSGVTCGLYKGLLLVDPTAEEEPFLDSVVHVVLGSGGLHTEKEKNLGEEEVLLLKATGSVEIDKSQFTLCLEAARQRRKKKESMKLL